MDWKDQGWGNRKSRVIVREVTREKIVHFSEVASHEEQRLDIVLSAVNPNETFHVWVVVGGGGGHSIHLSNVRIQALVFDDTWRSYGNALARAGTLPAWDALEDVVDWLLLLTLSDTAIRRPRLRMFSELSFEASREVEDEIMRHIRSLHKSWAEEYNAFKKPVLDGTFDDALLRRVEEADIQAARDLYEHYPFVWYEPRPRRGRLRNLFRRRWWGGRRIPVNDASDDDTQVEMN